MGNRWNNYNDTKNVYTFYQFIVDNTRDSINNNNKKPNQDYGLWIDWDRIFFVVTMAMVQVTR